MLRSIDLRSFRGFDHLRLKDLGQVNLIVGKNNTGKTSLLEAATLLANPELLKTLHVLFRAHVGPVELFDRWLLSDGTASAVLSAESEDGQRQVFLTRGSPPRDSTMVRPFKDAPLWHVQGPEHLRVQAVSVQHRGPESLVDAFAEAVRSPVDERQMESLLHAVDPRIRAVRLDVKHSKPFIAVDVGLSERLPLPQLGQGVVRLVEIFSELLGNKPKLCLIDELENGVHYTALPKVWTGIAQVAERLGIQVFATTHSRECLVAAHEAFAARSDYALRVIQLYTLPAPRPPGLPGGAEGRVLARANIEAAIAADIEVR